MLNNALQQLKVEFPSAYDFMKSNKDFIKCDWDMSYLGDSIYREECFKLYNALDKYDMAEYRKVCETALGFLHSEGLIIPGIIMGIEDLKKELSDFVVGVKNEITEEELIEEICRVEKLIWKVYNGQDECVDSKILDDNNKNMVAAAKLAEESRKKYEILVGYRADIGESSQWKRKKCLLSKLDSCLEDLKILLERIDTAIEEIKEKAATMSAVSKISYIIKGYLDAI